MAPKDEDNEVNATRRAMIAALASAPLILTLVPGRARAEYSAGEYFDGSCDAPPDQAETDVCGQEDTGGGTPGGS